MCMQNINTEIKIWKWKQFTIKPYKTFRNKKLCIYNIGWDIWTYLLYQKYEKFKNLMLKLIEISKLTISIFNFSSNSFYKGHIMKTAKQFTSNPKWSLRKKMLPIHYKDKNQILYISPYTHLYIYIYISYYFLSQITEL